MSNNGRYLIILQMELLIHLVTPFGLMHLWTWFPRM